MEPSRALYIIERCTQGDRMAQQELFNSYRAVVVRIVCRMLGSPNKLEVEDVIGRAYVELFRSLPKFKGLSSFDTWVYRICTTVCLMHIRSKYRSRKLDMVDIGSDGVEDAGSSDPQPDGVMEKKQWYAEVHRALDGLRVERRAVFVLCDVEGHSLDEAAEIIDCPVGTVKSRLSRARDDMRKALEHSPLFARADMAAGSAATACAIGLCIAISAGWFEATVTQSGMEAPSSGVGQSMEFPAR